MVQEPETSERAMLSFPLLPLMLLCQLDLMGQGCWQRGAVLPRRSCGDSLVEMALCLLLAVPGRVEESREQGSNDGQHIFQEMVLLQPAFESQWLY